MRALPVVAAVLVALLTPGLLATGGTAPAVAVADDDNETATAAPTPEPTETSEDDESAEPTETSEDSETSEPTETSEDSETAEPTESSDDGTTTEAGEDDETTESTETSEDEETAEPTEAPEPTEPAEPTEAPEPTEAEADDEEDGDDGDEGEDETDDDGASGVGWPVGSEPLDVGEPGAAGAAAAGGVAASGLLARRLLASGANAGTAATSAAGAAGEAATADSGTARSLARTARWSVERAARGVTDRWWRLVGLAGYVKWAGEEPLEHDTRAALYDHVQDEPGTYLSAFEDAVDASLASSRYHLDILEREGLVASEKIRGKRRYYPVGAEPDALGVALDEDTPGALLEALAEGPDTVSELADAVDRHPSTVTHHLDRLAEEGLVERERDGEAVVNRLTPGVAQVLADGPETAAEATAGAAADD